MSGCKLESSEVRGIMYKKTSKAILRSRMRCKRIANVLLEGPECIVPPARLDKHGRLVPVLSIISAPIGVDRTASSWSIYVDGTTNRDKGFLKPVVRYAYWERPSEYLVSRVRKWPKISVAHHVLVPKEQSEIDTMLKDLDRSLSRVEFAVAGLITDRSNPEECHFDEGLSVPRYLQIMRHNFCQRIELTVGHYSDDNKYIEKAALKLTHYIESLCVTREYLRYREHCYVNLTKEFERGHWFYRPPIPR